MKKLTILLVIVMFGIFGVRCLQEPARRAEEQARLEKEKLFAYSGPRTDRRGTIDAYAWQTTGKNLVNYSGVKRRGSEVKSLFNLVEEYNKKQVYPVPLRYGDIVPNSYEWTATIDELVDSGDSIRDNVWFEIVMQNQLERDDYFIDTIAIRPYSENYKISK